jgi:hypothetical protein
MKILREHKRLTALVSVAVAICVVLVCSAVLSPSEAGKKKPIKKVVRVSPTAPSVSAAAGKSIRFKAACQPSSAKAQYKKLTYKSSNPKVISVSASGAAKTRKNGTAVITARNTSSGLTVKWKVRVYSSKTVMDMITSSSLYNVTMSDLTVSSGLRGELASVVKACGTDQVFNNQSYVVKVGKEKYRLTYRDGRITNTRDGKDIGVSDLKSIKLEKDRIRFGNTRNFRIVLSMIAENADKYKSKKSSYVHVKFDGKQINLDQITFNRGHVQFKTDGSNYDAEFGQTAEGKTRLTVRYVSGKAQKFSSTAFGKALVQCGLFAESK